MIVHLPIAAHGRKDTIGKGTLQEDMIASLQVCVDPSSATAASKTLACGTCASMCLLSLGMASSGVWRAAAVVRVANPYHLGAPEK